MTDLVKKEQGEVGTGTGTSLTRKGDQHADDLVFVTVVVAKQLFGVPVTRVQDIVIPDTIRRIPLAPTAVAGAINLRGRIITVIDTRKRLSLPPAEPTQQRMSLSIEKGTDVYGLLVDTVEEVLTLSASSVEPHPPTIDDRWRAVTTGVVRLENRLLLVLDADSILKIDINA